MVRRWAVTFASLGLAGCLAADQEKVAGRAIEDDRILPVTQAGGAIDGVDGDPTAARWTEGHFAGVTLTLAERTQVVITADATATAAPEGTPAAVALDPVILVYGPRSPQGSWSARLVKVDAAAGTTEQTPPTTLEAGQYLVAVGEFERRAGEASVRVARALTIQTFDLSAYVFGEPNASNEAARTSWLAACEAWRAATITRLGDEGTQYEFSCGEPSDLDSGSWAHYASQATLTIRAELAGPPRVAGARVVTGAGDGSLAAALRKWRDGCDQLGESLVGIYGARLLGVSCGTPEDLDASMSWYIFQSTATVTLAPVKGSVVEGAERVTATIGHGGQVTALLSFEGACDAWMIQQAARAGDRLESIECGRPDDTDASSNWYDYSATGTVRFVAPPGREPVTTTISPIRGGGSGSYHSAVSSWETACAVRILALGDELGPDYLAATCGTPRDTDASSNWYELESTPMVWLAR